MHQNTSLRMISRENMLNCPRICCRNAAVLALSSLERMDHSAREWRRGLTDGTTTNGLRRTEQRRGSKNGNASELQKGSNDGAPENYGESQQQSASELQNASR